MGDWNPTGVIITGRFATDDGAIFLEGNPTGINSAGYDTWMSFTLGGGFQPDLNPLSFVVNGGYNPRGLRVEFLSVQRVPEPASMVLLVLGSLGGLWRGRRTW